MPEAKKRILVVEDDDDARSLFAEALEQRGFAVDGAPNLQAALMLIDAKSYHVALVDIMLAGRDDTSNRDGLIVLKRLQELNEGTQRIVLSGQYEPQVSADTLQEYGAFRYIDKDRVSKEGIKVLYETVGAALKASKILPYGREKDKYKDEAEDVLTFLAGGLRNEAVWVDKCLRILRPKGGYTGLIRFFRSLCEPFAPLMPETNVSEPTIVDESRKLINGKFWSKGLGRPIYLVACQASKVEELLQGKISPEWNEATELHKYDMKDLIGFAFELRGVDRSQFVYKLS